jgi:hypothetical protein
VKKVSPISKKNALINYLQEHENVKSSIIKRGKLLKKLILRFKQENIVEYNYELPNGKLKAQPGLIISNETVFVAEDIIM